MRQHEAQRPDDVRRELQQHLALAQRLAHQAELVVLEVAQAAVDQLGRGRGGGAGEVALLAAARPARGRPRRGRCRAVDAAADDQQVVAAPAAQLAAGETSWRYRFMAASPRTVAACPAARQPRCPLHKLAILSSDHP